MAKFFAFTLKTVVIVFMPIAVIGFVVSRQAISGDQYAAVMEILGSEAKPGAIEVFGADTQTISALLDFLDSWSLLLLILMGSLGILGLIVSKDRLIATFHICLGLFFSFGIWALFLSRSRQAFTEFIGSAISDLSALVMAAFISELSAKLLNLTGLLALLFASLAIGFWLASNRRKARGRNSLN
jgi:hypothetical protein